MVQCGSMDHHVVSSGALTKCSKFCFYFPRTIVSVLSVCVLSSVEEMISGSKILFLSTSRRRLLVIVRGEIFLDSTVLKSQRESTERGRS